MAELKVTYWAISVLSSRTMWLNTLAILVAASSLTEVTTIVPPSWLPTLAAIVAVANIILRTQTVRPVAFIAAGATKPVQVDAIGPPPPPTVTD